MNASEAAAKAKAAREINEAAQAILAQARANVHAQKLQDASDAMLHWARIKIDEAVEGGATRASFSEKYDELTFESYRAIRGLLEKDGFEVSHDVDIVDHGDSSAPCRVNTLTVKISW